MRKVDEWIGKSDDTPIPARVKLRVFEDHGGRCAESGRKIGPGDKWECDHKIAIINGGENRESNLQPVLAEPHKAKTKQDVKRKAKIARVRKSHLGIQQTKKKIPYRRFDGTAVFPK
ncbi:HNH endonuclease [Roseinatronobacter sp. NSM]|uniref:HNH endonuclease n=1 Tax=Roseinatronobacter sp. NSM TaxID=3457785 RepID=UPI004035D18E